MEINAVIVHNEIATRTIAHFTGGESIAAWQKATVIPVLKMIAEPTITVGVRAVKSRHARII
jgi:hypothetical protein